MGKTKKYRNCEIINISFGGLEPIKFEDLLKIRGGEEILQQHDFSCKTELYEQYKTYFENNNKQLSNKE